MFLNDLRFAFRQLYKNPGYTFAIVLTLALGIGVNTAVFSMVDGFLLRSLPYPEPDRIAALILHQQGSDAGVNGRERTHHDSRTWIAIRDNVPAVMAAATSGHFGVGEGANLTADTS